LQQRGERKEQREKSNEEREKSKEKRFLLLTSHSSLLTPLRVAWKLKIASLGGEVLIPFCPV
jgi:hypothetical protein